MRLAAADTVAKQRLHKYTNTNTQIQIQKLTGMVSGAGCLVTTLSKLHKRLLAAADTVAKQRLHKYKNTNTQIQ